MGKISVIIIGAKKSGKTQLANCVSSNKAFSARYVPTVGVPELPAMEYGGHEIVLYDTGSDNTDWNQVMSHLKTKQYVVVVCIDSTNVASIFEAEVLLEHSIKNLNIPVVLVQTKIDRANYTAFPDEFKTFSAKYDYDVIGTSALNSEVGNLQTWIYKNGLISHNPKFYAYLGLKLEDLDTLIKDKESDKLNKKHGFFPKSDFELELEIATAKTLHAKLTTIMEKKDSHKFEAFFGDLKNAVTETEQEHGEGLKKHGKDADAWYRRKPKLQKFTDALIADASRLEQSKTLISNNNNN